MRQTREKKFPVWGLVPRSAAKSEEKRGQNWTNTVVETVNTALLWTLCLTIYLVGPS